ncbi:zinc-binding alcohol dehydrogenase family protein [Cryptosporangium sp. NPDC048952]|uniref:quinone oxidoreductase family protein n=1 Tax=Cryptosporangium sp. NPDC048952 TaxID=3363961 RepID=UPI00371F1561
MRAIQVSEFGGPEVLVAVSLPDPVASSDEILVDVHAAGVNYADTSRAAGSYRVASPLPFVPGTEVVGVTANGRRVVGLNFAGGGYASVAAVPAAYAVEVPSTVDDAAALALLVQGLTAWYLLRESARIRPGDSVVVNAAAGGVGSLAVQLAREFGARRVIAAASSVEKRELALSLGASAAIDSSVDGYVSRVRDANGGEPVDVVLDATGGPALTAAIEALAPLGRVVTYGNASRSDQPVLDTGTLGAANAGVLGFWLRPLLERPSAFTGPLGELLALVAAGKLRALSSEYALADARQAHEDLRARRTTGKVVLRVS